MARRFARVLLLCCVWALVGSASPARAGNLRRAGVVETSRVSSATPAAPAAPALVNSGMECAAGFEPQPGVNGSVPSGWTALLLDGHPMVNSTRVHFAGSCAGSGFIERIAGEDSLVFLSEDIETPPAPGKPFDAVVYQQVRVTPGVAYSLSGWLVSLCGGSAMPNDCPAGYTMTKLLGLDPAGGADPQAASVVWVADSRNFTESRWANLRLSATAQGDVMTLFVRVRSPFRWHGAHAFADAISLVAAPSAGFVGALADAPVEAAGGGVEVGWTGNLSADIAAIPGGAHRLVFDVQYRQGAGGAWLDWLVGQPAGGSSFAAAVCRGALSYEFRVRARAEQPQGTPGAWPNQRYPGEWSAPAAVRFLSSASCVPRVFLPFVK